MAATVRPRGPLPPRVYWARRLLVLGVPLLLVVVLARVLGGSADGRDGGSDGAKATQAGARTTAKAGADAPVAGPTAPPAGQVKGKGRKGRKAEPPPEPVLAEPTGPCDPADIVVTPVITEAAGGNDVPIPFNLRTLVTEACTWHVSPETLTVTITSGDDDIWSSRECPASVPVQDVVVRQAVDTPVVITWDDARRSDETCSKYADWARLGWYHVQAAALGGEETDVQFELVKPSPAVVTKTVEPEKPGRKKGKKGGQQDTTHEPGEDGGGNSAG